MRLTGSINGISRDYADGAVILSLRVIGDISEDYQKIKDEKRLEISINKRSEKRTKPENAYFWVLARDVAAAQNGITTEDVHEKCVFDMCIPFLDDSGQPIVVYHRENFDPNEHERLVNKEKRRYFMPIANIQSNAMTLTGYMQIKGTSDMDTREMAECLSMLIDDAKALGIDPATPQEIERFLYSEKTVAQRPNGRP